MKISEKDQPVAKQLWTAPQLINLGAEQTEGKSVPDSYEFSPGSPIGPS